MIDIFQKQDSKEQLSEREIQRQLKDELNYLMEQQTKWKTQIDPITIFSLEYLIQSFCKSMLFNKSEEPNFNCMSESNSSEEKPSKEQREQTIHQLREIFDVLFEQTLESSNSDPIMISSLIHLTNVYGKKTIPKGFETDEFLDRFYEKNSLGPYRNSHKPFYRYFTQWKKRNSGNLKFLKRKAYLTTAMIIVFTISVFHHSIYVQGRKEVFQVQKYNEDSILFQKEILELFKPPLQNLNSKLKFKKSVNSTKIPKKYHNNIYLPLQLFKSGSYNYQFYEVNNDNQEQLCIKFICKNTSKWLDLSIWFGISSLKINYTLGNIDILQEDICYWNNAQIYLNEKSNITNILFEIGSNFYIVNSNIPKKELVEIINQMEEYK